jgi:protein-disulfide isomerase
MATVNWNFYVAHPLKTSSCPAMEKSLFFVVLFLNSSQGRKSGGSAMPRKLLTAIFLVLCLAAYAPPAGSADGASGLILSGSADSPVKLEVFSDFECPACSYFFFNAVQPVLKNYKDRVSVVYYEFPLNMHPYARPASRYISATARLGDQKKLLMLFETLFAEQDKWALDGNLEASVSKALSPEDLQKVKSIMETEGESIERGIDRDVQLGADRKITGTPTIFLNYAGKQERVVMPPNIRDMYTLLSWRLNGLLK